MNGCALKVIENYGHLWHVEMCQSYYDPCHTLYHMEGLDLGWVRLVA